MRPLLSVFLIVALASVCHGELAVQAGDTLSASKATIETSGFDYTRWSFYHLGDANPAFGVDIYAFHPADARAKVDTVEFSVVSFAPSPSMFVTRRQICDRQSDSYFVVPSTAQGVLDLFNVVGIDSLVANLEAQGNAARDSLDEEQSIYWNTRIAEAVILAHPDSLMEMGR